MNKFLLTYSFHELTSYRSYKVIVDVSDINHFKRSILQELYYENDIPFLSNINQINNVNKSYNWNGDNGSNDREGHSKLVKDIEQYLNECIQIDAIKCSESLYNLLQMNIRDIHIQYLQYLENIEVQNIPTPPPTPPTTPPPPPTTIENDMSTNSNTNTTNASTSRTLIKYTKYSLSAMVCGTILAGTLFVAPYTTTAAIIGTSTMITIRTLTRNYTNTTNNSENSEGTGTAINTTNNSYTHNTMLSTKPTTIIEYQQQLNHLRSLLSTTEVALNKQKQQTKNESKLRLLSEKNWRKKDNEAVLTQNALIDKVLALEQQLRKMHQYTTTTATTATATTTTATTTTSDEKKDHHLEQKQEKQKSKLSIPSNPTTTGHTQISSNSNSSSSSSSSSNSSSSNSSSSDCSSLMNETKEVYVALQPSSLQPSSSSSSSSSSSLQPSLAPSIQQSNRLLFLNEGQRRDRALANPQYQYSPWEDDE